MATSCARLADDGGLMATGCQGTVWQLKGTHGNRNASRQLSPCIRHQAVVASHLSPDNCHQRIVTSQLSPANRHWPGLLSPVTCYQPALPRQRSLTSCHQPAPGNKLPQTSFRQPVVTSQLRFHGHLHGQRGIGVRLCTRGSPSIGRPRFSEILRIEKTAMHEK